MLLYQIDLVEVIVPVFSWSRRSGGADKLSQLSIPVLNLTVDLLSDAHPLRYWGAESEANVRKLGLNDGSLTATLN